MTTAASRIDYWRDVQGGFRGSHLLAIGAILLGIGALVSLAGAALGRPHPPGLIEAGWLSYILGLAFLGLGFGWTCVPGILPRIGIAAAILHVGQAAYLLVLFYDRSVPPVAPVALSVGRLLALLALAFAAATPLGRRCSLALGIAAAASLLKVMLRVLGPRLDGGLTLDGLFLLLLSGALLMTARRLRGIEDEWACRHHQGGRTDFSEFNNPEHDWNKSGGQRGVEHARAPR